MFTYIYYSELSNYSHIDTNLDTTLGITMRDIESIVEHSQILFQAQSGAGELLLLRFYVCIQLSSLIYEYQLSIVLQ